MDGLKWDDLRMFLAVARRGTLAGAGSELGVNASTVHRRIAELEAALEASLFGRDPRGYALTPVGEALVSHAEEVEEAVLSLCRAATNHDRTARGPVTLTMPPTLLALVAPALAKVQQNSPGLRPILLAEDRILDLGGEVDVALRSGTAPPTAVGRRAGTIAWAVYQSGQADRDPTAPWVIYHDRGGPEAAREWQKREHPDGQVVMEVSTVGAMYRVLCSTGAQGLLPCYLGDQTDMLERRTGPIPDIESPLWLLIHTDLRRSARVRALIDVLVPELAAMKDILLGVRTLRTPAETPR